MFAFFHTKISQSTYAKVHKTQHYVVAKNKLKAFCKHARLPFRNLLYVYFALMHKSYVYASGFTIENSVVPLQSYNNERLEFLGDALLSVMVAEYVYAHYPNATEAFLSKLRSYVVSQPYLSRVGNALHVRQYIFSVYDLQKESHKYNRIVANVVEALIGALYLDRGYARMKKVFLPLFIPFIQEVVEGEHLKDYKSILQTYTQKKYNSVPQYICVATQEKKGELYFKVHLQFHYENGKYISSTYVDTNKKRAEQQVAKQVCSDLDIHLESEFTQKELY